MININSDDAFDVLLVLPLQHAYADLFPENEDDGDAASKSSTMAKRVILAYPNGVLSLAAYTRKYFPNVRIRIVDCNALILAADAEREAPFASHEDFWGYCLSFLPEDFNPCFIGVSTLFTSMFVDLPILSTFLRKHYQNAFIAAGGHLASACFKEILATCDGFDAISFGEGEKSIVALLQALHEDEIASYLERDNSWIIRTKLETDLCFSPVNCLIENLDEIPRYNLNDLVRLDMYRNDSLRGRNFVDAVSDGGGIPLYVFTSRGCPGKCVFCASQSVHGHKPRFYSPERVESDVVHYLGQQGVREIQFSDDHFLMNKKRAIDIMERMMAHHVSFDVINTPFFSLNEDVVKTMKKAGVCSTIVALENANEDTLRHIINKPGTLDQVKRAVALLRKYDILVRCNLLTGFPGETKEAIEKNITNALEVGANWFDCFVASPLPGSRLYQICKEQDCFIPDSDIFTMGFGKCIITTTEFTPDYIERKVYEISLRLNFVNNYDMRVGRHDTALMLFERLLRYVVSDHAFALYFSALCCREMGMPEKYEMYRQKYEAVIAASSYWREWVEYFEMPALKNIF